MTGGLGDRGTRRLGDLGTWGLGEGRGSFCTSKDGLKHDEKSGIEKIGKKIIAE